MTPEDKLAALFAAQKPRTPDLAFQAAVAQRIAARRAWAAVAAAVPLGAAGGALAWLLAPLVEAAGEAAAAAITPTAGVVVVAALILDGVRRLGRRVSAG